jgi:hypothetical protein
MGTSQGYAGSGGAWNGAQRDLDDLISGGTTTTDDVCGDAAGALGWDAGGEGADGDDNSDAAPTAGAGPIPLIGASVAPIRVGGRGRGGGGGGGGGAGGGARTGGRGRRTGAGGGGATRSRQRAARAGARVAAAGYALRAGDAAALRALGLDLAALAGLSPSQQARRIVDVIVGTAATIQDAEIARASATMVIRLLERDVEPPPAEVLRIFATEYVYEVFMTELGSEMRDGTRDGADGVVTEDDIHDLIEARVASLQIDGASVDAVDLEDALDDVLEFTRRIIHERPNG